MFTILYSSRFAKRYKKLPSKIQDILEVKEAVFRENPFDSRLKTHKLRGIFSNYWSFSVDYSYRVIFAFVDKEMVKFLTVGDHDIYDEFLS